MILFFWYVSFVLSNFFLLLSFSLSYVPVTLTISFSSNRQVCIQTTRFFFLFQYAERSIILSLLFFCLSFHSIEKPSSKICFILTITHFLSLFLFDNVVSFCLPSTPRKSDRLYARSFFICSHRSTTKQEQHSSSVLNAQKQQVKKHG